MCERKKIKFITTLLLLTLIAFSSYAAETVYITKTGKKYHREYCKSLKKSKIPIELNQAKQKGYTACKLCW